MNQFLARKNISLSLKVYLVDALSGIAAGLFATLIVGLILKTAGEQIALLVGETWATSQLITIGTTAMGLLGAGIGLAIAHKLQAPPLVLFTSIVTGMLGASTGGPAGAFITSMIACEFGKAVSKETQLDLIVTPSVTMIVGSLVAVTISPFIAQFMAFLGNFIVFATNTQPFLMGILVSVVMGFVINSPLSSAALALSLNLSGLAAGAATVGCASQMIGFAVTGYKDNGVNGLVAVGLGTSKLQMSNIIRNPWIALPPTLAAAIVGPMSTIVFKVESIAAGAGMGTSGFVGPLMTLNTMGFSSTTWTAVAVVYFILPATISYLGYRILYGLGKIKAHDQSIEV